MTDVKKTRKTPKKLALRKQTLKDLDVRSRAKEVQGGAYSQLCDPAGASAYQTCSMQPCR